MVDRRCGLPNIILKSAVALQRRARVRFNSLEGFERRRMKKLPRDPQSPNQCLHIRINRKVFWIDGWGHLWVAAAKLDFPSAFGPEKDYNSRETVTEIHSARPTEKRRYEGKLNVRPGERGIGSDESRRLACGRKQAFSIKQIIED